MTECYETLDEVGVTRIRTYPTEKEVDGVDTANQIKFDLKGTFGWRIVVFLCDGEICQWVAHHDEYNRVVEWWPNYYDQPSWVGHSIYAFLNGLRYHDEMALVEWPDHLDEDAQVVL